MAQAFSPTPVPCEAARYGAEILYLPDLWADAAGFQGWSGFLGHRGWAGWGLPIRNIDGGLAARVTAVTAFVRTRHSLPVLIGHGAGAIVAAAVAQAVPVVAVVLVAPLVPVASSVASLLTRRDAIWPLLTSGRVSPPEGAALDALYATPAGSVPPAVRRGLADDSARVLLDLARGRVTMTHLAVRSLILAGACDALTSPAVVGAFASTLGADLTLLPNATRALTTDADWRRTAGMVHRWLVSGLEAEQLEFYAEAMADRDADDDEPA